MRTVVLPLILGLVCVLLWLAVLVRANSAAPGSGVGVVEIAGSSSAAPLLEELAQRYMRREGSASIRVNGTGSTDGIRAAAAGTVDFGMSSRTLREDEQQGLSVVQLAIDPVTVIVHPDNPVRSLSLAEIRAVYRGEIDTWSQLTVSAGAAAPVAAPGGTPSNRTPQRSRIVVVSREPGSGTRGAFETALDFRDQLGLGAIELDGSAAVRAAVARNPAAIGYISSGFLRPEVAALEGAAFDGAALSQRDVSPLARPLLLIYREGSLSPAARRFLAWLESPEGQLEIADIMHGGRTND
ncbi:phosphate ABC transporter substrate-binding protein [Spirochaeta africana]|uniref:ABC-type phosphate transport system, periplasmic component n=1 Tax=Spirochaeta africana (strain ATCC 700263 / DSM 8902 / Z-7692) TaxID=889378 RepID=H9UGU3_SPIAZ|nr:phosphate ABC transporter substrate-binding protein [Spirochaeta africana]AFG36736.1 ABC-type phosphate transport system, periplasmic component [Spirochaeta africana DSM 8902]